MTGLDSPESEAVSRKIPTIKQPTEEQSASIPKHRDVGDQLTQAEALLIARNDLDSLALGSALWKSQTVLIPKCEDKERLKSIDNGWPITIGPMLLRLFTKIMAKHRVKQSQ
ncbi:hypothetical protein chiPu_0020415 [Chiloscyllium punctatum]|uniref:Uncharacterized protein n=1 Tax=Chiloscyllium punctatum TaxID=137246 RepID=A0A401RFI9_CHIPU|nr:hypothetical protein [Chiloscyllium punctatum]